jgi:hypothetical protein
MNDDGMTVKLSTKDQDFQQVRMQQGRVQLDSDWTETAGSSLGFFGVYRGQVVDNNDPQSLLRLKVRVPEVLNTQEAWALPCIPVGTSVVPVIGTGVWIMFERGDPAHPVWIGTLVLPQ